MQQKTLEMIEELKKDYYVKVEEDNFQVDDYMFSEWGDDQLLVTYYRRNLTHKNEYDCVDEVICHELDEVQWWINSGRDY
jgi:hypothetical protein